MTVLFACVHNAGRSQMAAALFNALADPAKARAISAGTQPGERVHPEVVAVLREAGIGLGGARRVVRVEPDPERLRTLVHWTNWRMTFPSWPGQQERVAHETMAELRAGRPVQLFVTDFPHIQFNHSVLAFDYRVSGADAVDFVVYDPNDPEAPGIVRFDRRDERFHAAPLCGVTVECFRAFRQYYSPFF